MIHEWFLISSATLIESALFCAVLLWVMRGRSRPKTVLALASTLIFTYMAVMLCAYYLRPGFEPEKLVLSYSLVCITLTTLIYVYFRELMRPWEENRRVFRNLVWCVGGYTALYWLFLLTWGEGPALSAPGDIRANIAHPMVLLRLAAFLTFTVWFVVVWLRTLALYRRHKSDIAAQFSYREDISLSWVPYLIVLYTLYGIWTVADLFVAGEVGWFFIASNFIYAGFYLAINFLGLSQQDIYTRAEADRNRPDAMQATNGIPPEIRRKLREELETLMETQREYRNPELRLDSVARRLNTNRTYLSTVIREDFGNNFIGFVNSYRVREAKEALSKGAVLIPIVEISERVGFKSLSSFNAFFKRETGTSPAQYRKLSTSSD